MAERPSVRDIRPSPIAGQWYPGAPQSLTASVDAFLADAPAPRVAGNIIGVIAPHAGHRYSGAVAAHAFKAFIGLDVDTIAVISPMHHVYDEPLLTTGHEAYGTPLGEVPVDHEAVRELQSACAVPITPVRRDPEHSLEIELPFLQRIFSSFKLIPVMIREQTVDVVRALAAALARVLRQRRALLVASTDLSHFYSQPVAEQLDWYMLDRINAFDPLGILQAEEEHRGYACGKGAMAAVLMTAKTLGADQARVVKHATSGDVTGDYDSVVGYGAAVIWKSLS